MKNIINKSGVITQIDELKYPLSRYRNDILNHINSNTTLSKEFVDTEMISFEMIKQRDQRIFGEELVPHIIDMIGERNLTLLKGGSIINISGLASDNAAVKLLIETGALATASLICQSLRLKYVTHVDIYDYATTKISDFLLKNGY